MQKRDADFLVWIAKRLVYKYKENPDIINVVQNIVNDNTLDESVYKNLFLDIHATIDQVVQNLSEQNQIFMSKFQEQQEKLPITNTNISTISSTNSLFENLDLSKLFR